jgi:hypothetical protein
MKFLFVCLAAHDSESSSMDFLKRQTSTATPAEPGGLPLTLALNRIGEFGWRRQLLHARSGPHPR